MTVYRKKMSEIGPDDSEEMQFYKALYEAEDEAQKMPAEKEMQAMSLDEVKTKA